MPFNQNITPGAPPLLWSDVNDAFTQINENFDILVATVGGGSGLTPIDFTSLDTSVKPTVDDLRDLGDITHKWGAVFSSEHTLVKPLNGLWAGSAQIKGVGLTINLPSNSTIGGDPITGIGTSLIIDPDKTFFKTIEVDAGNSVVADTFGDTLNLISGSGVSMLVSSGADAITISNTGVLTVAAGLGITVSTVSGTATVTNEGVRSLQNITALPSGRSTGAGINISAGTGDNVRITNTGVITISSGVGITVSTDAASGDVTITNSAPAVNAFTQIEVNGDSANRLAADAVSDVLNINGGEGITLTKNVGTDTLSIAVNPVFDLKGSVFGDDSSVLVDAVNGYIYGNVSATTLRTSESRIVLGYLAGSTGGSGAVITIGSLAGATNQGTGAMAIGPYAGHTNQGISGMAIGPYAGYTGQGLTTLAVGAYAGQTNQGNVALAIGAFAGNDGQGTNAVAIGPYAGGTNQGAGSIAIGLYAGSLNQSANSIVLNASGVALNGSAAGLYIDPIRSTTSAARPVVYDSGTKELFYTSTLEFINSTISTSDSSGLIVDVQTTFNTDVRAENDLTVVQTLTANSIVTSNIPGFVSVALLKSVVAASTDFADFQARIAALV